MRRREEKRRRRRALKETGDFCPSFFFCPDSHPLFSQKRPPLPPPEKAMPTEEAFAIIEKGAGAQFDPNLARVFMSHREAFVNAVDNPAD